MEEVSSTEELIHAEYTAMTDEERAHKDAVLHVKRQGMSVSLGLLALAMCGILYMLQFSENMEEAMIWNSIVILTLVFLCGVGFYWQFINKLLMDLESNNKITEIGVVTRGNLVNPAQPRFIAINVNGREVILTHWQLKSLLANVMQMNRIFMHDKIRLDYTPYGRHLVRVERL